MFIKSVSSDGTYGNPGTHQNDDFYAATYGNSRHTHVDADVHPDLERHKTSNSDPIDHRHAPSYRHIDAAGNSEYIDPDRANGWFFIYQYFPDRILQRYGL